MSGGNQGKLAHQILDKISKFEANVNGKVATIAKICDEVVKKHNDLAAGLAAQEQMLKNIAGFTASEMGKFQGETAKHVGMIARSVDGLDLNVLALAELAKELVGQLTQIDVVFKKVHAATKMILSNQYAELGEDAKLTTLTPGHFEEFNTVLELSEAEIAKIREDATAWYKNLVSSAFSTVQERRAAAEKEQMEAEAKAKAEAEEAAKQAEAAKSEKESVEAELQAASEAERTIVTNKSGGPGTAFPEGADIFGG